MSTEQPAPPSIPPQGRPPRPGAPVIGAGTAAAPMTPSGGPATTPETVAAAAAPVVPGPSGGPTSDPGEQESVLAGSRARAAAAGGAAAGAVRRVVRGATAAAISASSGASSGDPSGTASATTPGTTSGTGRVPRASHTEGDPTMAATDTAPRTGPARTGQAGTAAQSAPARDTGPRRVRLNLSRIDPWSVMKLSFLLSFAIGIMIVVAAVVVWFALDSLAVFTTINDMITEIVGQESPIDILQFLDLSRVVSGAMVVAVVDVVLLTALSTIGAFLYNITAALVGGVNVTLTDE